MTINIIPSHSYFDIHFMRCFPDTFVSIQVFVYFIRRYSRFQSTSLGFIKVYSPSNITLTSIFLSNISSAQFPPISLFTLSHLIHSPLTTFSGVYNYVGSDVAIPIVIHMILLLLPEPIPFFLWFPFPFSQDVDEEEFWVCDVC